MILGLFGRERLVACARVRGGEELRGSDMKGAFSANPRQEHEYHVFEQSRPPDGKILIPGVISHTTNLVEHPELIAQRIVRPTFHRRARGAIISAHGGSARERGGARGRSVPGHRRPEGPPPGGAPS